MVKTNYKFDKRQRDLARIKKQEDKRLKKQAKKDAATKDVSGVAPKDETA